MRRTPVKTAGWTSWLSAAVAAVLVVVLCAAADAQEAPSPGASPEGPNFVFVLTDDQDAATLRHMPNVRERLATKGTLFKNFVLTLPTCCPSRATFLRGQYAHNHGISGSSGAAEFAARGLDTGTVATWLDGAGYRTALFGKYLNGYRDASYVPPGWDRWHANANRDVWANCFSDNGEERCYDDGENLDALLADKAKRFVRESSAGGDEPFFLWLSFNAPHQYMDGPPPSEERDAEAFAREDLPRPPSFDEADVSDKPPWLADNPPLATDQKREMTFEHRARLASLQTVDREIGALVNTLAETGELDDTYFIFTTDNGYHMGHHRLEAGKFMPYKEDVNFPLIARGPGVARDARRDEFVLNTDFAPTVADLAGEKTREAVPDTVDGRSFAPLLRDPAENVPWRDAALVEGSPDSKRGRPAFSGVWKRGGGWYVGYETGETELYNLANDPCQLRNLAGTRPQQEAALSARLEALRDCAGDSCRAAENGPSP